MSLGGVAKASRTRQSEMAGPTGLGVNFTKTTIAPKPIAGEENLETSAALGAKSARGG
jgi:hypothetical protein